MRPEQIPRHNLVIHYKHLSLQGPRFPLYGGSIPTTSVIINGKEPQRFTRGLLENQAYKKMDNRKSNASVNCPGGCSWARERKGERLS